MEVIPALDLRGGRCVRLYQGDFHKETVYSDDPVGLAARWGQEGAPRLHIVDLDGAREGKPANLEVVRDIATQVSIPLQVGGGVRDLQIAQELLDMGVDRVVVGTAAVQDPQLVENLCSTLGSDHMVVAVDARDGRVSIKGWQERTTLSALELTQRMAALGVVRFLYTDVARDGTMTEPNFQAVKTLVDWTGLAIQASGGVSTLEHIRKLAQIGVEGVVIGSALLRGDITIEGALAAASSE